MHAYPPRPSFLGDRGRAEHNQFFADGRLAGRRTSSFFLLLAAIVTRGLELGLHTPISGMAVEMRAIPYFFAAFAKASV